MKRLCATAEFSSTLLWFYTYMNVGEQALLHLPRKAGGLKGVGGRVGVIPLDCIAKDRQFLAAQQCSKRMVPTTLRKTELVSSFATEDRLSTSKSGLRKSKIFSLNLNQWNFTDSQ